MQPNYPQKSGLEITLKKAFFYWSKTLLYHVLFSLVYFSVFFLVYYYVAERYGILEKMMAALQQNQNNFSAMNEAMRKISALPEYYNLSLALIFAMTFLYPLNLGLLQIFRKIDLGEKYNIEDLFVGYNGINFFKFSSYFLFWIFVYQLAISTLILGIVWVYITLFTAPLMFFMDKRIFETINLNIKALKLFFLEISVAVFVAFTFRYFGIITLIGFLFTFPFWNAMIYSMYQKIFTENK